MEKIFHTYAIENFLNQPDKKMDFYAGRFELMPKPKKVLFPHKHDFYEILLIKKGQSTQNIDYKSFTHQRKPSVYHITKSAPPL